MKLKLRVVIGIGCCLSAMILLSQVRVDNLIFSPKEVQRRTSMDASGHFAIHRKNFGRSNFSDGVGQDSDDDAHAQTETLPELGKVDLTKDWKKDIPTKAIRPKSEKPQIQVEELGIKENRTSTGPEKKIKPLVHLTTPSVEQYNNTFHNLYQKYLVYAKKFLNAGHRKTHRRKPGINIYDVPEGANLTSWELFHNRISQFELYNEDDHLIDQLLHDMANYRITDIEMKSGGTQLKLIVTFGDDGQALFKPMRFPRDVETNPDHFYFTDYERHVAEIASFHLDRILGFHRVPPTVGRVVNMTYDIKRHASSKLAKTFFISPANNVCFYGSCSYYCDTSHAICGKPDLLEGSFSAFVPSTKIFDRKTWRHPWRRSYNKHRKASWEKETSYCSSVRRIPPYNTGRRLLDIMDMAVFDFLIGNLDRHHYETFKDFGNYTYPLHFDQGRAFGKAHQDEISCLAPIYQCCLMRYSTLQRLLAFDTGPVQLGELMRQSLGRDPVNPVLLDGHFKALDRRVKIILKTVHMCIEKNDRESVVIDDGF